jgi:hypothetical protein
MPNRLETEKQERRKASRAKISRTVWVRPFDFHLSDEVCATTNLSRTGLYFETSFGHYYTGMYVAVVRNFQRDDTLNHEETAKIMRVERLNEGRWGVAIHIL